MNWMAWTVPTALFFFGIGLSLIVMTVWALRAPDTARRGFLPMATTRGDRFFIALLASAFVHAGWLAVADSSVLIASGISLIVVFTLMRWG